MNRIAIFLIVLLLAALAILLVYRFNTSAGDGSQSTEIESLLHQVRDGNAAAEQARNHLNRIIDDGLDLDRTLDAHLRLAELEQMLGNHAAASHALLDAIQSHPGNEATPRLLLDLGLLLEGPLDRPDEAREVFNKVVQLYPDHALTPEATIRLARIRLEIDNCERSTLLSDVHEISRVDPNHPLADEALFLVDQYSTELAEHE